MFTGKTEGVIDWKADLKFLNELKSHFARERTKCYIRGMYEKRKS